MVAETVDVCKMLKSWKKIEAIVVCDDLTENVACYEI